MNSLLLVSPPGRASAPRELCSGGGAAVWGPGLLGGNPCSASSPLHLRSGLRFLTVMGTGAKEVAGIQWVHYDTTSLKRAFSFG